MDDLSRRSFGALGLQALLLGALLQRAARADALTGALGRGLPRWAKRLDESALALTSGAVKPRLWQQQVEEVLGQVELADLLRSLDFERLAAGARFPAQGEGMQRLYFPDEEGRLQPLAYRPYLFTLKRGTAVVPHGHHNMATLHLVLDGNARVRHFDRLESTPTHMLVRPATDVLGKPGDVSSVSDEHHNIHWFEALTDRVFMFNLGVYQVRPGPFGERDYVDPVGGTATGEGVLWVARLDRAAAYAKYGHS